VGWSRGRIVAFGAGVALVVVALVGPLHRLSFELLSAHLWQNVLLAEWAPALLAYGLPPELGARVARHVHPLVALPVWLATYFAWHAPALYDAALRHPALLQLEHLCYLTAGLAFWLPLAHGTPSNGVKAAYVFAAFVLVSPLGFLLTLVPEPAYSFYDGAHGLSALEDQQLAGATMLAEEAVVFFAALAYYFVLFVRDEQ